MPPTLSNLSPKVRAAIGTVLLLAAGLILYATFAPEPQTTLSPADQTKINQALEAFYTSLPTGTSANPMPRADAAPTNKVQTTVTRIIDRKSRKQLKVTVHISVDQGPPPDGITTRTITLTTSTQGEHQVMPILPLGAEALGTP